jgi:hypothetical protein
MKIKKEHWIDATWWLFASSIGALMPIWLTWFILVLFQLPANFGLFTQNGEFALYSASLLSTAFYIITKDYAPSKIKEFFRKSKAPSIKATFPAQLFFVLLCFITALLSALLFTGTTIWHLPGNSLNINLKFVNTWSIIFFIVATGISYVITAIDNSASGQSDEYYRELFRKGQDELQEKFDTLGEE